ncbi:AAA family ATPase [Paraburkholderia tuberum]|uniref:AAA domain-containing protein n=1 Tax=Paraburkholderia tuberum TaxID=157910 RepID=A0A1H1GUE2_9BURK|nr:AAA family ATPase [Paraburkholderia tuberum]SDR16825.1 AAA domain-containing protein [Paraburkholderia tuberum]
MKLTHLLVRDVLGIAEADVHLTKPVGLFAGANGAGKSSIQEAVRMALTGDTVRVSLKKAYGQLLHDDAKYGHIIVTSGDAANSISLPAGKLARGLTDDPRLPMVLDAQCFAQFDDKARRSFLYELMGVKVGSDDIRRRLVARLFDKTPMSDADKKRIESVIPMVRAGIDAAHKEAGDKARAGKTAWRVVTGETYGSSKADGWAPAAVTFDEAALLKLEADLESLDGEIGDVQQEIGAAEVAQSTARGRAEQIATLRTTASQFARLTDLVQRADNEVAEFKPQVDSLRERAGGTPAGIECACPECGALLRYLNGVLSASVAAVRDDEAIAKLPEYEASLTMLQNAAANRRRELEAADTAAKQLRAIEGEEDTDAPVIDVDGLRQELADLQARRRTITAEVEKHRDQQRAAAAAGEKERDAASQHADVQAWEAIADALAPDGIPADLMREALQPLNEQLTALAEMSEWADVTVTPEMEILADGRPYQLLSESERWRADAHLACAISLISGLRLLVLDRADVLIGPERDRLFYWLDDLAYANQIDTALIFMSLKEPPKGLPETIETFWIEGSTARALLSHPADKPGDGAIAARQPKGA